MASIRFTNLPQFRQRFQEVEVDIQQLAIDVIIKIALDIYRNTIRKTPVDTGLLRNSWFIALNEVTDQIGLAGETLPSGQELAALETVPGDTLFIFNNVEYAEYIEFGTDRIAPRLMLTRSIEEALGVLS